MEVDVRNLFRTRRIAAADIAQLRTGAAPMQPFGRTVYVVTRADAFALDACSMWSFRRRSEQSRAALETWWQGASAVARSAAPDRGGDAT